MLWPVQPPPGRAAALSISSLDDLLALAARHKPALERSLNLLNALPMLEAFARIEQHPADTFKGIPDVLLHTLLGRDGPAEMKLIVDEAMRYDRVSISFLHAGDGEGMKDSTTKQLSLIHI